MPGYAFKKQVGFIVGQLSVSGFWPAFLCLFGCMYFFSLTACDCSVILSHNKVKNCRPCFQKQSGLARDTEAPVPLNDTNFKLQLCILTYYSPFTLLVTSIYTKCFFLFSICVKQN